MTASDYALTDTITFDLTVIDVNRPPSISIPSTALLDEGDTLNITGTAYDPDGDTLTLTIQYGDGSAAETTVLIPGDSITLNHKYLDNGDYKAVAFVEDRLGGSNADTVTVQVKNVPPSVNASIDPIYVDPMQPVHYSGSFTDPGELDTHTITWYFSDSTSAEGSLNVSHTYSLGGIFHDTLKVVDKDGGKGVAEVIVKVRCSLYPIAMYVSTIANISPGELLTDVYQGSGSGNFGWLSWTGRPDVNTLVQSLIPPGNSNTYVNPDDPQDTTISIGDWVSGKPGVSNSKKVRDALDNLKDMIITVPLWDEAQGNGKNLKYRVAGYAYIQIVDYHLPGANRISAIFWGLANCPEEVVEENNGE